MIPATESFGEVSSHGRASARDVRYFSWICRAKDRLEETRRGCERVAFPGVTYLGARGWYACDAKSCRVTA
jgi:hypothetical protein